MRRFWTGLAIAISLAAITAGGVVIADDEGPPAGTANLWIDEDGGTCVRQSTPAEYASATACDTLQEAADSASTTDTILIMDGSYEGMQLTGTETLTFRAAGPGRPSFGQIITSASNITVEGIEVENRDRPTWTICPYWDYTLYICGDNNTWTDVVVDGLLRGKEYGDGETNRLGGIQLTGNSHFLDEIEVKDVYDNKGFQGGGDDLVVEDSSFHNVTITATGAADDVHLECAAITEGNNQIWRRNHFYNCGQINWVAQNYAGGPAFGPVILEGNVFEHPVLNYTLAWQAAAPCLTIVGGNNGTNDVTGWIVRYNTFECDLNLGTPTAADEDDGLWYGNLGADPGCSTTDEWVVSYNVGSVCSSEGTNRVVANALNTSAAQNQAPFYVNAPGHDFSLAGGSNDAVNIGSAPNQPSVDIAGASRPFGASIDAGAYERQS